MITSYSKGSFEVVILFISNKQFLTFSRIKSNNITYFNHTTKQLINISMTKLLDPKYKGSVHVDNLYEHVTKTNGSIYDRILDDRLVLGIQAWVVMRHYRFFEKFDETIQRMTDAGFLDHYAVEYEVKINPKRFKKPPPGPEVLLLEQIKAGKQRCQ
jgi:hypothetical protein